MGQYQNVIFIIVVIAVFYFLIIRPQQTRQKQQAETIRTLAPGVEIVTIGGIYGTIVSVDDERVRISVADGSEIEVAKPAIGRIVPTPADEIADEDDADGESDAELAESNDEAAGVDEATSEVDAS